VPYAVERKREQAVERHVEPPPTVVAPDEETGVEAD
jgi:hypothetical protein